MIIRYSDHAANERTYLAWIRTAIAIMALGFLVEKFELYITHLTENIGASNNFFSYLPAEIVGLVLLIIGVLVIISSTIRFYFHKKAIVAEETLSYSTIKSSIVLSILIILLVAFLVVYMGHNVFN